MRPSLTLFSKSGSSKQWLARQARDPYVKARLSGPGQYRARSAFKLIELDKRYNIFRPRKTRVVVDLGAAPGGWSQVVAERLGVGSSKDGVLRTLDSSLILMRRRRRRENEDAVDDIISDRETSSWSDIPSLSPTDAAEEEKESEEIEKFIIALDLLPIAPMRGVRSIRRDFLTGGDEAISSLLPTPETKVDVILSDMAPNISGNKIRDEAAGLAICEAVYRFAARHLQAGRGGGNSPSDGGTMVLKHFANESTKAFYINVLKPNFYHTYTVKPDASRGESSEYYFVSKGFKGDLYHETNNDEFDVE